MLCASFETAKTSPTPNPKDMVSLVSMLVKIKWQSNKVGDERQEMKVGRWKMKGARWKIK